MSAPINPRGIFDRSALGRGTVPVSYPVERGRIAFFCAVTGEGNPIHVDTAAAQAAGFADIVAPPTFAAVLEMEAAHIAARLGQPSVYQLVNADLRYLLHGSEHFDYFGPMIVGEDLEISHRITGFEDKKGGALELCHFRVALRHAQRGEVAAIRRTLVHRLG